MRSVPIGAQCGVRGQSELLGLVLVFGMVIGGSVAVVMLGAGAMDDSRDALGVQRAEKAMTQFDSKSALVALGTTDVQSVTFPRRTREQLAVEDGAGELSVKIKSLSGGPDRSNTWTLGALVYSNGRTRIAYQGGGVWRRTGEDGAATMVSPPEFHFRNGTLTLPVISVSGDGSMGERVTVSTASTASTWHPAPAAGWPNPLDDHRVFVNVTSEYYRGWGEYFEERTDGRVRYDHSSNEVSLELVTPIGTRRVTDAVASLSPTGTFRITGTSANPCTPGAGGPPSNRPYANSYNSSNTNDDYCDQFSFPRTTGNRGNITYGEDIDISTGSGGSAIKGDLRSGGSVKVSSGPGAGQPYVDGDIYYTTTCQGDCTGRSTGSVTQISGVASVSAINGRVSTVVSNAASGNDNGGTDAISGNRLVFDEGPTDPDGPDTATLTAGTYYLEAIDFSGGDTLEVDTSAGPVRIAVRDYVDVGTGDEIHVFGDGIARVYVRGDNPLSVGGDDVMLRVEDGDVTVRHDDAPELRFYGRDDFNATISNGIYTGVIYAPPGASGTSSLIVDHGALIGGAVVADTEIGTQGSIHYDEALRNQQIVSRNARVVKITFLHVSHSDVRVGE